MRITIEPANCPVCARAITSVFDADAIGRPAKPSDFLICVSCASCLIIGDDHALREPTYRELARAAPCTRVAIIGAQRAILARVARETKAN